METSRSRTNGSRGAKLKLRGISVDRRTGAHGPPRTWSNTGAAAIEEAWHCLDNGRCRRRYPDGEAGNPHHFFIFIEDGEASGWTGVSGFPERGFDPHLSPASYLPSCVPHSKSHGGLLQASCIHRAPCSLSVRVFKHFHGSSLNGLTSRFLVSNTAWFSFLIASFFCNACK